MTVEINPKIDLKCPNGHVLLKSTGEREYDWGGTIMFEPHRAPRLRCFTCEGETDMPKGLVLWECNLNATPNPYSIAGMVNILMDFDYEQERIYGEAKQEAKA